MKEEKPEQFSINQFLFSSEEPSVCVQLGKAV